MKKIIKIFPLLLILSSCERDVDEKIPVLKLYGDALEDIGYSISKSGDEFYIGGQFTEVSRSGGSINVDGSKKKMAVIKTDYNGNVLWKKSYGGSRTTVGLKVVALNDGSAISTGYIINGTNQKDIFVIKVPSDGKNHIQNIFNSVGDSVLGNTLDGNQSGIDIVPISDGFMLLGSTDVGRLQSSDSMGNIKGNSDIYLLKLDVNLKPAGVPVVIGFPGNDAGVAIKPVPDGGYIIAGITNRSESGQSLNNILIVKTTAAGIPTHIRILGTSDDEYASDIEVLDDGYFIAGTVGADGSDQSVYVAKVPENIYGELLFSNKYKLKELGSSTATSFAIKAICRRYKSNSFVMAGQAGTGSSAKMLIYVAGFNGDQVSGKEILTVASGTQVAYDVTTDEDDNVIVVGKNSYENNSMIVFYKFRF